MIAAKPIFDRQVLVMHPTNIDRPAWHRGAFAIASVVAHGLLVLVLVWHGPRERLPRASAAVDTVAIDSIDEEDDTSTDVSIAKEESGATAREPAPSRPVEEPKEPPSTPEPPPKIPVIPESQPSPTPRPRPTSSAGPSATSHPSPAPSTAGTGDLAPSASSSDSGGPPSVGVRAERNLIAAFLHELPYFAGAMDVWATLATGDGGRLKVTLTVSSEGKVVDVRIEEAGSHGALHDALERTTVRLTRGTYGLEKSEVVAGSASFIVHVTLSDVAAPDDPGGNVAIKRNIEKRTAEFTTTAGRRVAFQLERVELTKN